MLKIHVTFCWNDDEKDWTIEINDLRHDHVSSEALKGLFDATVMVAERSVNDRYSDLRDGQITSELEPPPTKWVEIK
jgi:hypothetical protein